MTGSINKTTTFALDLEACSVILLSALWLEENTCNEEAPFSIFIVCSPSILIIWTFFSYFLRKTNKWIGSVLFSPSLDSLNHFSLCGFFWLQTTYKPFGNQVHFLVVILYFLNTQSKNRKKVPSFFWEKFWLYLSISQISYLKWNFKNI